MAPSSLMQRHVYFTVLYEKLSWQRVLKQLISEINTIALIIQSLKLLMASFFISFFSLDQFFLPVLVLSQNADEDMLFV